MVNWAKILVVAILAISIPKPSKASDLRVGALGGIGQANARETGNYTEGPIGTEFFADYASTSRFSIGGKHTRSWTTNLGSSVSTTMLNIKYYLNNDIPTGYDKSEDILASTFEKRSHAIFIGISLGFAQSSVRPSESGLSASAVGVAGGGTAGFDWQIFENAGVRLSSSVELTFIGVGQITIIFGGAGFYLNF